MIEHNIEFPRTHNLEFLKELCVEVDDTWDDIDVSGLSLYAVETRYPENLVVPTLDDAKECFEKGKRILDYILDKWNISESELRVDQG